MNVEEIKKILIPLGFKYHQYECRLGGYEYYFVLPNQKGINFYFCYYREKGNFINIFPAYNKIFNIECKGEYEEPDLKSYAEEHLKTYHEEIMKMKEEYIQKRIDIIDKDFK